MNNPNPDRFSRPLFSERDDPRTDEELEDIEAEKADQEHQQEKESNES